MPKKKDENASKGVGGAPLWRGTSLRAEAWRSELGVNEYISRQIRYGVLDLPTVPFEDGTVLRELSQTAEDGKLAREDLAKGCREGV